MVRLIKVGVVVELMSPTGWDFFNSHLFSLIYQGTQQLIGIVGGEVDSGTDFRFLDKTLGVLLSKENWIKIMALVFSGPFAWICFIFIIIGVWSFLKAVFLGLTMYFMSIIAVSFLVALSPFFLASILFQRTKTLFDGWMKAIINYALQPVFLFSAISMLNEVQSFILHELLDYSVCKKCIVEIDLKVIKLCLFSFFMPLSSSSNYEDAGDDMLSTGFWGCPVSILFVFEFWLVAHYYGEICTYFSVYIPSIN